MEYIQSGKHIFPALKNLGVLPPAETEVKNFDYLAYYFYGVLAPFIGPYNVTDQNVDLIRNTIELAALKKTKEVLPKIGAPLKSYTINSVAASDVQSDHVVGKVKLDLPKPLNGIDLFLGI